MPPSIPKLMPKNNRYTKSGDIRNTTNRCGHGTCKPHTGTEVRKEYWIPSGRASVTKQVTSKCVTCKKANGQAVCLTNQCLNCLTTRVVKVRHVSNIRVSIISDPVKIKSDTDTTKCWVSIVHMPRHKGDSAGTGDEPVCKRVPNGFTQVHLKAWEASHHSVRQWPPIQVDRRCR